MKEIINILGDNHKSIEFTSKSGIYGLYTYRSGVYVFRDGKDIDFEDLELSEQNEIIKIVLSKNWKVNKSLQ